VEGNFCQLEIKVGFPSIFRVTRVKISGGSLRLSVDLRVGGKKVEGFCRQVNEKLNEIDGEFGCLRCFKEVLRSFRVVDGNS
jgi:hypothetical protein